MASEHQSFTQLIYLKGFRIIDYDRVLKYIPYSYDVFYDASLDNAMIGMRLAPPVAQFSTTNPGLLGLYRAICKFPSVLLNAYSQQMDYLMGTDRPAHMVYTDYLDRYNTTRRIDYLLFLLLHAKVFSGQIFDANYCLQAVPRANLQKKSLCSVKRASGLLSAYKKKLSPHYFTDDNLDNIIKNSTDDSLIYLNLQTQNTHTLTQTVKTLITLKRRLPKLMLTTNIKNLNPITLNPNYTKTIKNLTHTNLKLNLTHTNLKLNHTNTHITHTKTNTQTIKKLTDSYSDIDYLNVANEAALEHTLRTVLGLSCVQVAPNTYLYRNYS